MMPPNSPANDTQRPAVPRPICVPRPARPRTVTPPPAPRRSAAEPSKAAPPLLPSKAAPPPLPSRMAPPPLPRPALLSDSDLIDYEETAQAARAPQPTSEDVDLSCFTCTEPPPESRPQRKRAWFAGITGLVLVTMTGLFLVRSLPSDGVRLPHPANGEAGRVPAMLAVSPLSTPVAAATPQKAPNPSAPRANAVARPKASAHAKRGQTTAVSAKKLANQPPPNEHCPIERTPSPTRGPCHP